MPKACQYWMVKQEPSAYSWDDFVRDKGTTWTGVRNYQARINLRSMTIGDQVLFYHSVTDKAAVGIAKVTRPAYPDPTAKEGDWSCVDLAPVNAFAKPVTLAAMRDEPELQDFGLLRHTRLSVIPLTRKQFDTVLKMARK
ncbi:MAG: EVE domain-containing protein [Chthoniobacteraceae bacterium]